MVTSLRDLVYFFLLGLGQSLQWECRWRLLVVSRMVEGVRGCFYNSEIDRFVVFISVSSENSFSVCFVFLEGTCLFTGWLMAKSSAAMTASLLKTAKSRPRRTTDRKSVV